jgi:hypothetical protein
LAGAVAAVIKRSLIDDPKRAGIDITAAVRQQANAQQER